MNKLLVLFVLSLILFYPTFCILNYSAEYYSGMRDIFVQSVRYFDDFSIYSSDEIYLDSAIFNYFIPYIFYKIVPWDLIVLVSVFIFFLITLFNVYLLYYLFKDKKYVQYLVPLFYFSIPSVEYSTLLLINFLLIAIIFFKRKPYVSAVFMSLSLFTKQYALVPVFLLLFYRFFNKDFLKLFIRKKDFKVFLIQLLIIFLIQLIVYFPFNYQSVIQRLFFDVVSHGFVLWNPTFVFYFPLIALLFITLFYSFKNRDNESFLLFIFYFVLFFVQNKEGANIYLSVIPFLILFQFYYKGFNKSDFIYLFLIFSFFMAFLGLHCNFIFIGPLQASFIDQFGVIPNNTLFFATTGLHPFYYNKSTFETFVEFDDVLNISNFDFLLFNLHVSVNHFNLSYLDLQNYHFYFMPVFSGCVYCKQYVDFGSIVDYDYYFVDYYSSRIDDLCSINPSFALGVADHYNIDINCDSQFDLIRFSRDYFYLFSQPFCFILGVLIFVLFFYFNQTVIKFSK